MTVELNVLERIKAIDLLPDEGNIVTDLDRKLAKVIDKIVKKYQN